MGKVIFGVDLGGTTVKMGLFDPDGNVTEKWETPTDKSDEGKKILPDIADSIKKKMAENYPPGTQVFVEFETVKDPKENPYKLVNKYIFNQNLIKFFILGKSYSSYCQ